MSTRNLDLLKDFFEKDAEIRTAIDAFAEKRSHNLSWTDDNTRIATALNEYEAIKQYYRYGSVEGIYRWMAGQTSTDPAIKAQQNKIDDIDQEYSQKLLFFSVALSDMSTQRRENLLADDIIAPYRYFLQRIYDAKAHTLSEAEQKIESRYSKTAYSKRYELIEDMLAKKTGMIDDEEKSLSEILVLVHDDDADTRAKAITQRERIMDETHDLAVVEINNLCEYKKQYDVIHHYDNAEQTAANRDHIPLDAMHLAIETISDNFPLSQERYRIKTQLLWQETLSYHERNRKIGTITKTFERQEAQDIVLTVFDRLDPDFGKIARKIFADRIDVFPRKDKQWWAFAATFGHHTPDYMFFNFTWQAQDIVTLAHEMGHLVHFAYARQQNALQYSGGSIMAEVASTFFEDFVLEEIITLLDDTEKRIMRANMIDNKIQTIMRQIAAHNFEKELHTQYRSEGYVSDINSLFAKHMQSYLWQDVLFDHGGAMWWIYRSHFRSFFYTYYYALSLCISQSLQALYHQDTAHLQLFKDFMSSWGSKNLSDTFAALGIDVSTREFWHQGCQVIKNMIDDF